MFEKLSYLTDAIYALDCHDSEPGQPSFDPARLYCQVSEKYVITNSHHKVARRRITAEQSGALQNLFDNGVHFPTRDMREKLARQLSLAPRTIQVWFQNRRQACRNRIRAMDYRAPSPKLPIRWMKPVVFDQSGKTMRVSTGLSTCEESSILSTLPTSDHLDRRSPIPQQVV